MKKNEKRLLEEEKKSELLSDLLEEYIHAFIIFTKRNEITIKFEDKITLNEIFTNIKCLEKEIDKIKESLKNETREEK